MLLLLLPLRLLLLLPLPLPLPLLPLRLPPPLPLLVIVLLLVLLLLPGFPVWPHLAWPGLPRNIRNASEKTDFTIMQNIYYRSHHHRPPLIVPTATDVAMFS